MPDVVITRPDTIAAGPSRRRPAGGPSPSLATPVSIELPRAGAWRAVALASRVALLAAAGWALHRELADTRARDLAQQLRGYGLRHVVVALGCTALSFLLLGALEVLALRHAGAARSRVSRGRAILTAFVANALSQSIGLAVLTGSAVRHRAYVRAGVDGAGVARISAFVTLSATLGLLAAGGWALLESSAPLHVARQSIAVRPLGGVLLVTALTYVAWSALSRARAAGWRQWSIPRPSLLVACTQVVLSAADWVLTGAVLFAFLPTSLGIRFGVLMRSYLVAQVAGVASHVPGGVGVLELVLLGLLPVAGPAERAGLVAALVMFRVMYYLLPLGGAVAVGAAAELLRGADPLPTASRSGTPALTGAGASHVG